jgi:hypothetical protein
MELQQDGPLGAPTQRKPQRTRRRLAGALSFALLVGLTVGVSAATANSPSTKPEAGTTIVVGGGPATAGTSADVERLDAAFATYRDCMAEHGIDMPEPVRVEAGAVGAGGTSISGAAPVSGGTLITGTGPALGGEPLPALDAKAFEAADTACAPILEAAGIKTFSSSSVGEAGGPVLGTSGGGVIGGAAVIGGGVAGADDLAAVVAPIRKYAACMRDHGVNIPDPVVDEKAGTFEMKVDVDPTTSEFRAADAACADGGFSFAVPAAPAGK